MKKTLIVLSLAFPALMACNNNSKSTVEKADSINEVNRDSSSMTAIDEAGSTFLTKIADAGMAEVEIATLAEQKAGPASVKSFAAMLVHDHTAVNQEVKTIASAKNVVLPDSISAEKRKDVDGLVQKKGTDYDKSFVNAMIDKHEGGISLFEKTLADTKDADVKTFINNTLPKLRMHLDSAKALKSNLHY
jgi:putative membrane protein